MSVCGRVAFGGSGDDNGDAGAGGQPRAGAFPKAFARSKAWLAKPSAWFTPRPMSRLAKARGRVVPAFTHRRRWQRSRANRSALQQRFDSLVEFLERGLALDHLAIDEEGRRRIDLQHFAGVLLIGFEFVDQRLVLEAILDRL